MLRFSLVLAWFVISANAALAGAPCRRIGVTLPLTMNLVAAGENFRNGILLAQEQFDPQREFEFIFEDDQFAPANTIAAVRHLI